MADDLQQLCDVGQEQLSSMDYVRARATLEEAERLAWEDRDWDTLARLYMPLQEAHRQIRQRCGEGTVRLDLVPDEPGGGFSPDRVIGEYNHGQLLVAGWGTIQPALAVREIAWQRGLYVETFLGAAYPTDRGTAVAIVPLADAVLPGPTVRNWRQLASLLPARTVLYLRSELPAGARPGDAGTFSEVMAMWERLHAPFLAAADAMNEPQAKIEAYRGTIRVDYACELAHQKLARTASDLLHSRRGRAA
jgi:hypothetical protein